MNRFNCKKKRTSNGRKKEETQNKIWGIEVLRVVHKKTTKITFRSSKGYYFDCISKKEMKKYFKCEI